MKLYVDDVRPCPVGWHLARTVDAAKRIILSESVDEISLDHDMGICESCKMTFEQDDPRTWQLHCSHVEDGYALVMWLLNNGTKIPAIVRLHSLNPVGRARMRAAFISDGRIDPLGPEL